MENLNFKRIGLEVPSVPSFDDVAIVETFDGKLYWADQSGAKELADKPWANSTFLKTSTATANYLTKTDAGYTYVSKTLTLSGATHHIGKNINMTINSGTVVLTNCSGAITVSGNSAKVYINNCPNLTVTGLTNNNFYNVFRDGMAERNYIKPGSGAVALTNTPKDIVTLCTNYNDTLPYDELYILVYVTEWGNTPIYLNPYIDAGYHVVLSKGGFCELSVKQRNSTLVLTGALYNTPETGISITEVTLRKHV